MFGLVRRIVPYLLAGAKYRLPGMTTITHAPLGNAVGHPGPAVNLNDHVNKPAQQRTPTDKKVDDPMTDVPKPAKQETPTDMPDIRAIVNDTVALTVKSHLASAGLISDAKWNSLLDDNLRVQTFGRRSATPRPRTNLDQLKPIGGSADFEPFHDWEEQYKVELAKKRAKLDAERQAGMLEQINQTISRIEESESKKANKEAVDELEKKVSEKALKTDVDELEQKLSDKADKEAIVEMENQLPSKADKADVDELQQKLAKKADKADVDMLGRSFASFGERADRAENDAALANTKIDDLDEKVRQIQLDQRTMNTAIDANTETGNELRGRVTILEQQPSTAQVNMTNPGVIPTAIPSAEQPQSKTGGCDPEKVEALDAKTNGHDQRLKQLETAMGDLKAQNAPERSAEADAIFLGRIQRLEEVMAEQRKSFDQQLRQQKEASEKQLSIYKATLDETVESQAAFRKEYEDLLASKDQEIASKVQEIASKDKALNEFAEYKRKNDARQQAQDNSHKELQKTVDAILSRLNAQTATIQQPPVPVQAQPEPQAKPSQLPPPSLGNGHWGSAPVPPNNDEQPVPSPDVEMGGLLEPDHEMMDAPPQPPQPQLPPFQPRPQPPKPSFAAQDDTPMAFGDPMVPSNNGNAGGFVPSPQPKPKPAGGNLVFPGTAPSQPPFQLPPPSTAPSQPPFQSPTPSAAPSQPPFQSPTLSAAPSQPPFQSLTPSAAPAQGRNRTPTGTRAEGDARKLFGSSARPPRTPAQQKPLADPSAPSAKGPALNEFNFATPLPTGNTPLPTGNTPLPGVNPPKMDWSAPARKLTFVAPPSLDDDDGIMAFRPKANVPPMNAAPSAPPAGQPAANNAPRGNAGDLDTPMANGSSSAPVAPPSAPVKPSTPKPAKKKADPFVRRKPGATPSQQKEVTSKAQTTKTNASSIAQRRQAIFAEKFSSELDPTYTVPPPPAAPASPKQPLPTIQDPPDTASAGNPSPFASKPKAPARQSGTRASTPARKPVIPLGPVYNPSPVSYKPVTPSTKPPRSSPLANHAVISDTIESPTAANIFDKEPEKPAEKPSETTGRPAPEEAMGDAGDAAPGAADDIQMSGDEGKPEDEKPLKYEADLNPRKHAAAVQIVPNDDAKTVKRETDDDARANKSDAQAGAGAPKDDNAMADSQGPPPGDAMETDHRRIAKPMRNSKKLTAEQIKSATDGFYQETAWDDMIRAAEFDRKQKAKAEAAAADDEVDYADPNDMNDEDTDVTAMGAAKPNVRPTKYSRGYFAQVRDHLLSTTHLTSQATALEVDFEYLFKMVNKHNYNYQIDDLIEEAQLPIDRTSFSACEIEMLINAWNEKVFLEVLHAMRLDASKAESLVPYMRTWIKAHKPDAT